MNDKNKNVNTIIDWLIYCIGYAIVLIIVSTIFKKTIQIDTSLFGLWALLAALLIRVLNRTIKPILFWLTIPITALTLGIFYPFLNVIILYMVSFVMGNHFNINGIFMSFLVAILISLLNHVIDIFINKILEKR